MRGATSTLVLTLLVAACGAVPSQAGRGGSAAQAVTPAPPLEGIRAGGGEFTLADLRGEPVVLVFYRGVFCGLCQQRLRQLETHRKAYERLGARVVAVTLDDPELAETTRDELELDLTIVSAEPDVFAAWGLWAEGERWPRPGEFVLDAEGRVRFAHVGLNASDSVSDVVLQGALAALGNVAPPPATARGEAP